MTDLNLACIEMMNELDDHLSNLSANVLSSYEGGTSSPQDFQVKLENFMAAYIEKLKVKSPKERIRLLNQLLELGNVWIRASFKILNSEELLGLDRWVVACNLEALLTEIFQSASAVEFYGANPRLKEATKRILDQRNPCSY